MGPGGEASAGRRQRGGAFPEEELLSDAEERRLWQLLGVEGNWLDLCVQLKPRFRDGKLHVSCPGPWSLEYLVTTMAGLLITLFRFVKFTHSRWLTVGLTCRYLLRSLLVGLEAIVEAVIQDPRIKSKGYIRGARRLRGNRRDFVVQAALASSVTDAPLRMLLADDRLAKQVDIYKSRGSMRGNSWKEFLEGIL